MSLTPAHSEELLAKGFSRRHLGRMASMLTAGAAALPMFSEFAMAQDAEQRMARGGGRRAFGADYVRISSNENPMGPSKEGLEALVKVAPQAWRYSDRLRPRAWRPQRLKEVRSLRWCWIRTVHSRNSTI